MGLPRHFLYFLKHIFPRAQPSWLLGPIWLCGGGATGANGTGTVQYQAALTSRPGGSLQSSLATPWCEQPVHRSQLSADRSSAQQQIIERKTHVCVSTSLTSFFTQLFWKEWKYYCESNCWSPTFLSSELTCTVLSTVLGKQYYLSNRSMNLLREVID